MVPYSERRHRIHGVELDPVREAVHADLLRRLRDREDLLTTSILFRFWYRIHVHCRNKPAYPDHETWEAIESYMAFSVKYIHTT